MIPDGWSAPDASGVATRALDVGALSTLRGRRLRRAFPNTPQPIDTWPAEWRGLLADWLRRGGAQKRWEGLIKTAGNGRYALAEHLRDTLLRGGWIELEERFERRRWHTVAVTFLNLGVMRHALGLPDPDARRAKWIASRDAARLPEELADLAASLDGQPPQRALARLELLLALAAWHEAGRTGTWRDFGQHARGGTKTITDAEKAWLAEALDLEGWGISGHTPLLYLAGPFSLHGPAWRLDLAAMPGFIGLTPETVAEVGRISGQVGVWRLVENRTSFERVAAEYGRRDGVIWLPGFAPSWWKTCVTRLITLCPANGLIACDPDPAGIAIALDAGSLFEARDLAWAPWRMSAHDLAGLPRRLLLTEGDIKRLHALHHARLPDTLRALQAWMEAEGEKGEQEGLL